MSWSSDSVSTEVFTSNKGHIDIAPGFSKVVQSVKVLAAKPEDLSWISETYLVEGRYSYKCSSDLHT